MTIMPIVSAFKLMIPQMIDRQPQSFIKSISEQVDVLMGEQKRLQEECIHYKELIDFQVKLIQNVTEDIERLQIEIKEKGLVFNEDEDANPPNEPEQNINLSVLVPPEEIRHPLSFVNLAEIVDVSVICRTAFSHDGKLLAIGSNKTIRVYNLASGEFECEFLIPGENDKHVRSLAWDLSNKNLVAGCEDHRVRIYNIEDKKQIKEFEAQGEVYDIKFANNGNFFVAAVTGSPAIIFNFPDTTIQAEIQNKTTEAYATCAAISPDDSLIAIGYSNCNVAFWSTQTNSILFEVKAHDFDVYALAFYDGGKKIATGSLDGKIKLWNVMDDKLELISVVNGHSDFVLTLAVDKTETWLLSGSKDQTIGLTDLATGKMIYRLASHTNSVITVDFSPTEGIFCTGSGDMSVHITSYMVAEEP